MRKIYLAMVLLALMGTSSLMAATASLTFYTLTAPHAAVGAQMQYRAAVTNTGTTTVNAFTLTVSLMAPNGSTYTLLSSKINNLAPGKFTKQDNFFTTSTFTPLTGAFTLSATLLNGQGAVSSQQSIPLTVAAAPSNGVSVSVGGMGPATAVFGTTTDYKTVTTNLSSATMSLTTSTTIKFPDGTTKDLIIGSPLSMAGNSGSVVATPFNMASFFSKASDVQTGTYTVTANVFSGATVMATDTYTFTRSPLPTAMVPTFTESSAAAGVAVPRAVMMAGMMNDMLAMCNPNTNNDYMMGGTGIAVADYDGDGNDDVFAIDMDGMGHLWHNNGNGTFTDMASAAGIPMIDMQSGAAWADVDNDGHPDLLIMNNNSMMMMMGMGMGGEMMPTVMLFHNNGNGTFTDATETSGLGMAFMMNMQNLQSATFGDYDGDGFLDLYITAHVDCMGMEANDHLFHNNGNGTFTEVTAMLGSSMAPQLNGRGLVAAFLDYNGDGRPDLYIGNDEGSRFQPNVLWRNDGPGGSMGWTLTDVSASTGANIKISDMGFALLDYTRTGQLSIFNTNVGANRLLQYQSSTGKFALMEDDNMGDAHVIRNYIPNPVKGRTGMTNLPVTWSPSAYDFNNDGWDDIFEAGGPYAGMATYNSALFMNNMDGTFLDVSPLSGVTGYNTFMPSAAVADFNNDGFMDIWVQGMMEAPQLLMNSSRAGGNMYNWLEVKLVGGCTAAGGCSGMYTNHDGIGARLVATVGGMPITRWVVNGANMQGNNTLIQHFGLGSATSVTSLTVYWPSGKVQTLSNVAANQKLVVMEP